MLRFFDVYEREHLVGARRAPATLASQRSAFNAIRRALASRELVEPLTPGAVFAWYRGRVERGELAESSANKHIEYLGMALRYARNFWPTVAIRDVTRDMPKFREPRRPPRVLAGDAAATLVALLDAMPGPLERAFLLVQTDDALRVSEALGLEGQDFDWQEQTVHIERQRKVDPRRGERVDEDVRRAGLELVEQRLQGRELHVECRAQAQDVGSVLAQRRLRER